MPILSVIIPTHNRAKYALKTIESILTLGENIEVVVTDTSEDDQITPSFSAHPRRDQLKLIRPGTGLSVVDNFNIGLSAATGEYLVFIGDDDFVSEKIIEVAEWAKNNAVDSIKFTFPVSYKWPDFYHKRHGDRLGGKLYISKFSGNVVPHDAKYSLNDSLNHFGYGVMDMPRAYLGMLSRKLANSIVKKYGYFFGGVSPDIFSAAMISAEALRCMKIDYPVLIPGASGASSSGLSASGKHIGTLRDNPHIGAFKDLIWDKRIPEFYSVPTVWSFSLLKAVEKQGENKQNVNFSRLYVKCFLYHSGYWKFTLRAVNQYSGRVGLLCFLIKFVRAFFNEFLWASGKIAKRIFLRFKPANDLVVDGLDDVTEASKFLGKYIKDNGYKINFISD